MLRTVLVICEVLVYFRNMTEQRRTCQGIGHSAISHVKVFKVQWHVSTFSVDVAAAADEYSDYSPLCRGSMLYMP